MGCSQSKIENEEAVSRCRDRKLHMKEAVGKRNAYAAAQASYAVSLRGAGAALNDYASGEFLQPHLPLSSSFPAATPSSTTAVAAAAAVAGAAADSTLPPPPPLPTYLDDPPVPTLQRAATMPEFVVAKAVPERSETIQEGDEEEEDHDHDDDDDDEVESEIHGLRRRRRGGRSDGLDGQGVGLHDEEDGRPPLPPETPPLARSQEPLPPYPPGNSTWDYFFGLQDERAGGLRVDEDVGREREWEREQLERKMYNARANKASEVAPVAEIKNNSRKVDEAPVMMEKPPLPPQKPGIGVGMGMMEKPPPPPQQPGIGVGIGMGMMEPDGGKIVKKPKQPGSSAGEGKRVVKMVNPLQVFGDLDDHFLQASESAQEVVKMLEAARLHYHSSFAQNCGHIDHSERVMQVITWNRSFRGLSTNDVKKDDFDSEEKETHATVLDKLLAWEKKLYDEVKAGELMKFEYQKKVALLNKQKKRNASPESLEKTKAAVSHLHTRYIVDMQSLDSTVMEINRLRDQQLFPRLVALIDSMAVMWGDMQEHHHRHFELVAKLRAVHPSQSVKETTEHHHKRTEALLAVVQEWHNQFDKMVTNQKAYIQALNNWLKLNLIPIESNLKEKVSSPPRPPTPPIQRLLLAWHDGLEKIPEELAKSAIYNFAGVIHTIYQHQEEELKLRAKVDQLRKDLGRKTRQFDEWYTKYAMRRMPSEDGEPSEDAPTDPAHDAAVVDKQVELETAKKQLEDAEEAYERECQHVREKSLTNLKTRMPELFRAMLDFSGACTEMYKHLSMMSHSQQKKQLHKKNSL